MAEETPLIATTLQNAIQYAQKREDEKKVDETLVKYEALATEFYEMNEQLIREVQISRQTTRRDLSFELMTKQFNESNEKFIGDVHLFCYNQRKNLSVAKKPPYVSNLAMYCNSRI